MKMKMKKKQQEAPNVCLPRNKYPLAGNVENLLLTMIMIMMHSYCEKTIFFFQNKMLGISRIKQLSTFHFVFGNHRSIKWLEK